MIAALWPRFAGCYAIDGSTLEALFRKLHTLREAPDVPLAGSLTAACDLRTQLPIKLWYEDDPLSNGTRLGSALLAWLPVESLAGSSTLGYFAFGFFDELTLVNKWFVTRLKSKTTYTVKQVLLETPRVRDRIVHLGVYRSGSVDV